MHQLNTAPTQTSVIEFQSRDNQSPPLHKEQHFPIKNEHEAAGTHNKYLN